MGLWSGIGDAETFERGRYVTPGFNGVIVITKTLVKKTRKGALGFIVEFRILETNLPDERKGHPVGQRVTWFQKLDDKDVAWPAVLAFVAACMGVHAHEKEAIRKEISPVIEDLLEHATTEGNETDNEFIGISVRLETVATVTKEKKQDFTRYDFSPHEPGTPTTDS